MTVQENVESGTTLDYRRVFGWPVQWHNNALTLVTGSGIGAVAVPRSLADRVLAGVARQGCEGPAVCVLTKHGSIAVLLVEADVLAPADSSLPEGVRVLTAGTGIPLPDERSPHNLTHWLVPPDTHHRWLPSLTAVLASIRSVVPPRLPSN
ncbi:hypothetical protein LWP59_09830 [Amycolatopsis acidiphila]|uniref:Uncharacterized protein n=1 Tax=Amycolatopsis acidiphila TaxID=715473 RepID=A0A558A670_9PSEU|nr:hypothetical protein [Amycolatopsis acidiphila]TVT19750.1 hypothetical protein FNH06_23030 [Amycolatopsis acidiphila]UIJ61890.1 hypothetical protein LWP59_09830 [Amycolatopsis acidiphila]GHG57342.1 hypothetical protein GCM10017788_08860 [Amycolatopsis acidiphila]